MEMEMEIPDPEELQWLESNAFEEDDYISEEEGGRGDPLIQILPPKIPDPLQLPDVGQTHRKRLRPDEEEVLEASGRPIPDHASGGTKRRSSEDDPDEDWLRYSPPPPPPASEMEEVSAPQVPVEKIISRFASEIKGAFLPVTAPNGDRVYAKFSSVGMDEGRMELIREKPKNCLLYEPISVLINRVEQDTLTKALQESIGSAVRTSHTANPTVSDQLWVEKYAPKSFRELLSDEQTNREVLLWLKQWDSGVFGSQIRATTDDVISALRRHSSISQNQKIFDRKPYFSKGSTFNNFNHSTLQSANRSWDRQSTKPSNVLERENANFSGPSELISSKPTISDPLEQKVLLLCGPPGLGKTTLAHVAAKHCGYGIVEINASDDRSSSTFESKLLDVMQMKSVLGDSKPKCLVIDEIDGALGEGKGAIEVILKMVAAEKKPSLEKGNTGHEAQPGNASLTKRHKTAKLSRPVICICNDLYAPVLRPLRQVAKVHTFAQPTVNRVVNRLKYICNKEGFRTSSIALSALAEFTECDIRSCLNTLQFLHKKNEALNILEVSSQVIGRKDISRSAFDVWKEVFQKRKLKHENKSRENCSRQQEFDFLYSLIANCGEYELIMNGIHENFSRLSYHDPLMQKTVRCLDVLGVSDSLFQYIYRTQQMSLQAYHPPIAIATRYLIAQVERPYIEWPKSLQRCRTICMERKDLLNLWRNKTSPYISRHFLPESFVEDIVSPLLHILSPPTLRPVALHLLTDREKDELTQLVDTMVSYSLTYKNSKPGPLITTNIHGAASDVPLLSLDPPIDGFANFKDYQSGHSGLSLTMKQVLVHEIEKQRIMRESIDRSVNQADEINSRNQAPPVANAQITPAINITTSSSVEGRNTPKPAMLGRQTIASAAPNSYPDIKKKFPAVTMNLKVPEDSKRPISSAFNFFDRFKRGSGLDSKNSGDAMQKAATIERDSRPLLFKYNEGFTNAVKRPFKIHELLL